MQDSTKWKNLIEEKCPKCSRELKFRRAKTKTRISSRGYQDNLIQDMYFCFRCNFQISKHKLYKIVHKLRPDGIKPKVFDTGFLQF